MLTKDTFLRPRSTPETYVGCNLERNASSSWVSPSSRRRALTALPKFPRKPILGVGASEEEILHAIVLALSTIGFPATNTAFGWAEEVLAEEAPGR